MNAPLINAQRLADSIEQMAQIGALSGGGCCRLALTDEDKAARDLFVNWCRDAGCSVRVDPYGNIFAVRQGGADGGRVVLTGSHLDTQPHGGRLDGIFGVLAGLEVIRTLNDAHIQTDTSVAVVNWTNEEGVRFSPGLTGSSGFSGSIEHDQVLSIPSTEGPTFGEELQRIGYAGERDALGCEIVAYIEAHIEQGPILESRGIPIGIVEGIQEVRWYEVQITGADRHAGTTPMDLRADSFMAASELALSMRKLALAESSDIRFTVGRVMVSPGSPNTVPGLTQFSIDLRHQSNAVLDEVESALRQACLGVASELGVKVDITSTMLVPVVNFDEKCVAAVEAGAKVAGYEAMRIGSGAMHDASRIAKIAPTAMIFVPSKGGISHHEDEWTDPVELAAGCNVLLNTVLGLARRA